MVSVGLLVPLHAKPGKEEDVAKFSKAGMRSSRTSRARSRGLRSASDRPSSQSSTCSRMSRGGRRIFSGTVAEALMAQAPDLFAQPPEIRRADVIASKLPE